MNAVAEAKYYLAEVPRLPDETKSAWLTRTGALFRLTRSQAKKIWYDEIKDMRASRLDGMRDIRKQLQQSAARRREILNEIAIGIATARNDDRGSGAALGNSGREGPGSERGNGGGEPGILGASQAPAAARQT